MFLEVLADGGIVGKYSVLVISYAFPVSSLTLIVELPLHIFLTLKVLLMPVHQSLIIISSLLDLICKLRVLLGNLDLPLQALFLIVQLAEAVL